jgi:hypothetical protein
MKESCGEKDYVGEFCYFLIVGFEVRCMERGLAKLVELGVLVTSSRISEARGWDKAVRRWVRGSGCFRITSRVSASPAGEPLYKKPGFVEYKVFSVDLSGYKGGEGKGINRVVILNRPARTTVSV